MYSDNLKDNYFYLFIFNYSFIKYCIPLIRHTGFKPLLATMIHEDRGKTVQQRRENQAGPLCSNLVYVDGSQIRGRRLIGQRS
jgi:hypothetical protein